MLPDTSRIKPLKVEILFKGIGWGLFLSILMGPILFALVQTGIERGVRAGLMVGLGIWVSDLLFILAVFFGVSYVISITRQANFEFQLGIAGGIILIMIGLGMALSKSPEASDVSGVSKLKSYPAFWLKGFLINTINPFTVSFWTGIMTTEVIGSNMNTREAAVFFGSILGTIMLTDSLKVVLAKRLGRWLSADHIRKVRLATGIILAILGVVLMIRVW